MRFFPIVFLGACAVDAPTSEISSELSSTFEVVKPAVRDFAHWSDARCNDGSPFGFYIRPNPSSHTWVIYFEGGGFCDDYAHSCGDRKIQRPDMITTMSEADGTFTTLGVGGLVSTNPGFNDFANANIVYAHYCSSDLWAGNTDGPVTTRGGQWWFKGHRNVEAMLATLVQSYGLDDSLSDLRVLVAGGSSGGFAVHLNSSRIESTLPSAAAAQRVKLAIDAGWWTEWDWDYTALVLGLSPTPTHYFALMTGPDRSLSVHARGYWNATYDPQCEASAPAPADCLYATYWYPVLHARLPILIMQSSEDRAFAGDEHDLVHATTPMGAWEYQIRDSFSYAQVDWLFSGGDPYHTMTSSDVDLAIGPTDATRLRTVIRNFWNAATVQHVVFDPVRPAVMINRAATQPSTTSSSTIHFTVQFSEAVDPAGFASAVAFQGTAAGATVTGWSPTAPASVFDVTVGNMTSSGTVQPTILANYFTGQYGRLNVPSVSYDDIVTYQP